MFLIIWDDFAYSIWEAKAEVYCKND